jgi:hypothetical protein
MSEESSGMRLTVSKKQLTRLMRRDLLERMLQAVDLTLTCMFTLEPELIYVERSQL